MSSVTVTPSPCGGRVWRGTRRRLDVVPAIAPLKVQVIAQTQFTPPADVPWETDAEGGQALAEFAGRACYQSWDKPNPATATNARLPAAHPRGRPPLGARARQGDHVPVRGLPVADPRADPAPALLLQPAVPAVRARADAAVVEPAVIAEDPELHERFLAATDAALAAYAELLEGLEKRFADVAQRHPATQAGPAGRPRGAAERHRDPDRRHRQLPCLAALRRHARRASTPTSRSASWPSPACASCSGSPARVRGLPDQRAGRRHRGRRQPLRHRGMSR